jgi:hypothetical protein
VPFVVIGQSWHLSGVPGQGSIENAIQVRKPEKIKGFVIQNWPLVRGDRADEAERHAE